MHDDTRAVHAGRHPERAGGAVNPPVIHASTIIAPTLADWESSGRRLSAGEPGTYYGRFGTATHHALEEALTELEAGFRTQLFPSGMAACAAAILSCVESGQHVLLPDSVYFPVRQLAGSALRRFGVSHSFYDPGAGAEIEALIRPETRCVYLEAPGSITFEMQDVPAIAELAHRHGARVLMDNTWATPCYFKPLAYGVDISIQAATKYIVGHADAMLGYATTTADAWPALWRTMMELGYSVGPDDVYLAQRGLRTLPVRLARHWQTGLALADWFARQPEVVRVMHPARPDDPGYALWRRDFTGASGLFGVLLQPMPRHALAALIDSLELFALGASWGGFESLLVPWNPKRTVVPWTHAGPCLRVHAGLEAAPDLLADLERGFSAMRAALG
jgi:cysteine-S-conjugate beta-lyase